MISMTRFSFAALVLLVVEIYASVINTSSSSANNAYGDEQVMPAGGGAQEPKVQYETAVERVKQEAPFGRNARSSVYPRRKRSTAYGDEMVTPEGGGAQIPEIKEQNVTHIEQEASSRYEVHESGYRKKRSANSYGDEQIMPEGGGAQAMPTPSEESASTVAQSTAESSAVEASGY